MYRDILIASTVSALVVYACVCMLRVYLYTLVHM